VGVVSSFLHISFLFLSVSFVFRIDSVATRETIITVSFLLVFWFFNCFLSHIYIYIWIVLLRLVLFGVGFSSARTVRREV